VHQEVSTLGKEKAPAVLWTELRTAKDFDGDLVFSECWISL
jgi:hypothetical protein